MVVCGFLGCLGLVWSGFWGCFGELCRLGFAGFVVGGLEESFCGCKTDIVWGDDIGVGWGKELVL